MSKSSGSKPNRQGTGEDIAAAVTRQWKEVRPDMDFTHQGIAIRIVRLGTHLRRENGRIMEQELNVKGEDIRVLFALRRMGPPFRLRPTDLFKSLLIPSTTITRQLDRLERSDLVRRIPDPSDRRSASIQLTERGIQTADAAVVAIRRESLVTKALQTLAPAEVEQLDHLLELILAHIEHDDVHE